MSPYADGTSAAAPRKGLQRLERPFSSCSGLPSDHEQEGGEFESLPAITQPPIPELAAGSTLNISCAFERCSIGTISGDADGVHRHGDVEVTHTVNEDYDNFWATKMGILKTDPLAASKWALLKSIIYMSLEKHQKKSLIARRFHPQAVGTIVEQIKLSPELQGVSTECWRITRLICNLKKLARKARQK